MAWGTFAAVPAPNNLVAGRVGGYTRWVTYLNPTTLVPEGMQKQIMLYNASGATLKGQVVRVERDGDAELDPKTADVTAQTVDQFYAVARSIVADLTWDWFIVEGPAQALVDGVTTDVAKDDYLKMTTATSATALTSDGTATLTADSLAIACEANTGAGALKKVILLGMTKDAD
ncbi:MAG: hypothetical protein H0X07_00185 [Gemmatimonadales bacterium]|nr:hypothetical protein [Gemmatimonadales bacterium]